MATSVESGKAWPEKLETAKVGFQHMLYVV